MAKHLELDVADDRLAVSRRTEAIAAEAALDGLYVLRTSVPATRLDSAAVVRSYKGLSTVERALRHFKSADLAIRPIHRWTEGLLAELATLTRNRVVLAGAPDSAAFELTAIPTPPQARAFALLGLSPTGT
jgi:hypothetical protein